MGLFDSIRERIKYCCVSDDEIIITQDKYEKIIGEKTYWYSRFSELFEEFKKLKEEQEIVEEQESEKSRAKNNIMWGESERTTGIITHYPSNKHPSYIYREGTVRKSVEAPYDELLTFKTRFEESGYDITLWNSLKKELDIGYYGQFSHGKIYQLNKGTSRAKAEFVMEYLEFKNWDISLKSTTVCNTRRPLGDDYYLTMKAIMEGDKEYQTLKNKEE